jgi:hypothetical protein
MVTPTMPRQFYYSFSLYISDLYGFMTWTCRICSKCTWFMTYVIKPQILLYHTVMYLTSRDWNSYSFLVDLCDWCNCNSADNYSRLSIFGSRRFWNNSWNLFEESHKKIWVFDDSQVDKLTLFDKSTYNGSPGCGLNAILEVGPV